MQNSTVSLYLPTPHTNYFGPKRKQQQLVEEYLRKLLPQKERNEHVFYVALACLKAIKTNLSQDMQKQKKKEKSVVHAYIIQLKSKGCRNKRDGLAGWLAGWINLKKTRNKQSKRAMVLEKDVVKEK